MGFKFVWNFLIDLHYFPEGSILCEKNQLKKNWSLP